ncbi:MAG: hypothetical protein ACTHK3_07655 [Solirubrobacterales bacterium]
MKARLPPLLILVSGLALGAAPGALASESAPKIESESVSAVKSTSVVLKAQIDPGGLETGYKFHLEYQCGVWPDEVCPFTCVPGAPKWEECSSIVSVPLPEGQLPPSTEVEKVSLNLAEVDVTLKPDTEYRYWVEGTNGAGKVEGSKEFFTAPASSSPLVKSLSAANITPRNATLEAWINPEGLETSYEFFLLIEGCCSESPDELELLAAGELPASYKGQQVTLDLNSAGVTLAADESYVFMLYATNIEGTAFEGLKLSTAPLPPEEEPGPPEEEPEPTEPPLHDGSPGAPQGEEIPPPLPLPDGGAPQGPPKAAPCHPAPRRHHAKHHRHRRHHRAGIGKACGWA